MLHVNISAQGLIANYVLLLLYVSEYFLLIICIVWLNHMSCMALFLLGNSVTEENLHNIGGTSFQHEYEIPKYHFFHM